MASAAKKAPPARKGLRNERGVAMLIAVVAITVLTIVALEFSYNSRVDMEMAVNQRDDLRAYYMAKSGIGLERLVLHFQKQIDSMPLNLGSLAGAIPGLSGLLGGGSTPTTAQTPPGQPGAAGANPLAALGLPTSINIQIWQLAKVDCHMLQGFVVDPSVEGSKLPPKLPRQSSSRRPKALEIDVKSPELAAKQAKLSFGGFDGCFEAHAQPEEPKLNLNKLDMPQLSSQVVVARLFDMLADKRFEFLFEQEDANHIKTTPQDLVIALHDWMDEDEVQSTLNLTGQGEPFMKGFADEAYFYDRYTPRYLPKNARYDTLDELYMVHGWNDRMMAAFRDRLTVYPDINTPPNINTDDPLLLMEAIKSVMDPLHPDPRLGDPLFVDELIKRVRQAKMFSFFGMSVGDFVNVLTMAGIPINPTLTANMSANRFISDKNTTYTITSVGQAGGVQKTITAVVRMEDQGMGRLLYWKEM
jgi:general secretion pathway protein K